ncbi:MAG: DNA polymerase III subunit alpha, partial [Actinobacteria bacterium]|nr:DNA polymerase III subunit alpha [Actinomycetota bacterium]
VRGELMATFTLEDLGSSVEVFVFPKVMESQGAVLEDDVIVCLKGRVDMRDDALKVICLDIRQADLAPEGAGELHVELPLVALSDPTVERLKEILAEHPGPTPVLLHVGSKVLCLPDEYRVANSSDLLGELRVLLGPNAVVAA